MSEDGKLKKAANSLVGQYIERIWKDEIISQDTIFKMINFICWSVRSGKMDIYPDSPPDAPGSQPAEQDSHSPQFFIMLENLAKWSDEHGHRLDAMEKQAELDKAVSVCNAERFNLLEKKVEELQVNQRVYDGMRLEKLENEVKALKFKVAEVDNPGLTPDKLRKMCV